MRNKPDYYYRQSGAIPFRYLDGKLEVALITSRKNKHWVIPKGIIESDADSRGTALKEAYEEAGLTGKVSSIPIGKYKYKKWGGKCRVVLFLLKVEDISDEWEEKSFRRREWFSVETAVNIIGGKKIKKYIKSLPELLRNESKEILFAEGASFKTSI